MSDSPATPRTKSPDALREYVTGLEQKRQGNVDAALTSFRRAVIADPDFLEAQLQIGWICKEKSKRDRMFQRYAFDAFRIGARLDPANQTVHDQYILAAQQSGRLEDLRLEYESLKRDNPQNELFQRCYKNIVTLSLAMMPQRVEVAGAKASGTMRKFTLMISLGMILIGLALIFLPAVFGKKKAVSRQQWSGVMKGGILAMVCGFGGVLVFTRMK